MANLPFSDGLIAKKIDIHVPSHMIAITIRKPLEFPAVHDQGQ